ncbi:hypothetical protein JKP88DRAFT_228040 [Tribonema minus]|uniref:Uncharacterized protein n=1 Tax=Tribonema minus TaxID=303371 RepID=A0A836C8U4_9STRA|nr:hypothetical protein JKP88DRAFT_228040 [Tribonema minus]
MVKSGGALVCLVKPQFEAERADIMAGGVVIDTAVHEEICQRAQQWLEAQAGWQWRGTVESPIRGLDSGNIEFLMYGRKLGPGDTPPQPDSL